MRAEWASPKRGTPPRTRNRAALANAESMFRLFSP
jgi:hypothetical protein